MRSAAISENILPIPSQIDETTSWQLGSGKILNESTLLKYEGNGITQRYCALAKNLLTIRADDQEQILEMIPVAQISHIQRVKYNIKYNIDHKGDTSEHQF